MTKKQFHYTHITIYMQHNQITILKLWNRKLNFSNACYSYVISNLQKGLETLGNLLTMAVNHWNHYSILRQLPVIFKNVRAIFGNLFFSKCSLVWKIKLVTKPLRECFRKKLLVSKISSNI